ncbi:MAG: hypothetical protein M1820_007778 [Bogoriella megaspora]|nr:MAG: hypothetical protein M1820_007778 [Bogoriella megaspora]
MTLNAQERIDIAQLVFYGPAGLVAIYCCFKHGFGRSLGFFYLILLATIRIVSDAITIYTQTASNASQTLIITGLVLSNVGTSPLLNALIALVKRVNEGMRQRRLPIILFRVMEAVTYGAIVLIAYGGSVTFDQQGSSKYNIGITLQKTGICIIIVNFVAIAVASLITLYNVRHAIPEDRRIAFFTTASLPFLLVRLIYSCIIIFSIGKSTIFNPLQQNVWAEVFMAVTEEFITVILFLAAGILTPRVHRTAVEGPGTGSVSWPTGPKAVDVQTLDRYDVNPSYPPSHGD